MSTMMSPFGLPEKRLAVTTASSGTTTSMMLQGHGDVSTRLSFDGNHLALASISATNNTSNYLQQLDESASVVNAANNSVDLNLRGWNHQRSQPIDQQLSSSSHGLSSTISHPSTLVKRESKSEIIHSGHFMVSQIDDQQDDVNEVEQTSDFKETSVVPICVDSIQPEVAPKSRYPVYFSPGKTFAPRRFVDEGLSKLFECMSLAYSGSITSPKWKTFKGLPLKLKDKIRLNNIIWRAWHIQYIIGRDPRVCQFSSPSDHESHNKAEAVILEGKYWKRRHTTVIAEYHKWRAYHKHTLRPRPPRRSFSDYHDGRWNEFFSNQDLNNLSVDDDFAMDFSDNLLNSLVPPNVIDFPNPREIARSGMGAEFIQPGLTQLQPCLDDFMEPLSDFLLSRVCIMPPLPEESTSDNLRDNWKIFDKQPRFGVASNPVNSDYMQMSYGDMLDVSNNGSNSSGVIKSFNANQGNSNATTVIQVADLPQQNIVQQGLSSNHQTNSTPAQPQSSNVTVISHVTSGGSTLDLNQINPLESVSLQVQNSGLNNNMPYSTQSQSNLINMPVSAHNVTSTNSLESQKGRAFGSYDCIMSMNSMNSNFGKSDQTAISQANCLRSETVTETNQSRGSVEDHFMYPKMPTRSPRNRSRSVSTPHMVYKPQTQPQPQSQSKQIQQTPVTPPAAINVNDHQSNKSTTLGPMERSISLPVYSQRRNAIGPLLNAQLMQQSQVNFSSTNLAALRGGNNLQFTPDSFNNNHLAPGTSSITPELTSHMTGSYSSEPSMNVTPSGNIGSNQITANTATSSDFTSDSNSLIAQLLCNTGSPANTNLISATKSSNDYEKASGVIQNHHHHHHHNQHQQQQPLHLYSSHPSLHGNMLNYPNSRQSGNLMSSNSGDGIGPTRPFRGRISGRLSDPEPPRGLLAGLKERVRKISSPTISPPPLLGSAYSPSSRDSNSSTPLASPQSIVTVGSPSIPSTLSSIKTIKLKSDTDKLKYKEHRRVCHINAEQKRRCNIKNGFDTLRTLLPAINQNANTKISKAAMLHKAAEYIRTMKSERHQRQEECENLRQQIETLNQTIGVFQSQLPATGAPISCQRVGQVKEQFDSYVKDRTMNNWKFWVFGLVMESLLESYMTTVTTSDVDDMCRSVLRWLDQNCSLVTLRREVLNSLRHLSTSTNILTSPTTLREEILESLNKRPNRTQSNQ
ncbi:protein WBSCR14 homolog [Tetranychus urticae]|uniref:protein WBSCR14 homolog n=1 Tax=Tetranychus urticae TaxID=32264 RepID=UPI00077BBE08|nr:protein WBSCR14 homolog [Tetranychus urticae]XP_015791619.1 protein WBSCR14 homolog [Tetranychus urticae]XP_015791620.1 protein WBSCR14 homolog [Tetranychus urticae]